MYSSTPRYQLKQSISFAKPQSVLDPHQKQKNLRKSNHLLQLKDQLVKMKNFLNDELPEINKLIPHKGSEMGMMVGSMHQISSQDIVQIVHVNRRLFNQNEKLEAQLERERSKKRQLSKSLKKHQELLTHLCDNTFKKNKMQTSVKQLQRKMSSQKEIKQMLRSSQKKAQKQILRNQSKQKACIFHSRKQIRPRSSTQKFETQTSIMNKYEKRDMTTKVTTAPCYSSSEQQMITNLQQVSNLQKKLNDLMRESQRTQNRTKKLQIRNQMEKVASRLNCLKQSLGTHRH